MDGFLSRQLGKEAEPDGGWLSQLIPDGSGNGLRSSVPASGPGWDALGRQATPTLGNGIRLAGGAVWGGRYPRIPVIEPPETLETRFRLLRSPSSFSRHRQPA